MSRSGDHTSWTMIRAAAGGDAAARQAFARTYERVARAYLFARWRGSPLRHQVDDALQEIFVESFRPGGALERAEDGRAGGFRAFFYGLVRNIALRFESRAARRRDDPGPATAILAEVAADEPRLSQVFDRAWARTVMRQAAARQQSRAVEVGPEAERRVELLRLRFEEGLPIRGIAALWGVEAAQVHREYSRARREFREALLEVVAEHQPGATDRLEQECAALLAMLG